MNRSARRFVGPVLAVGYLLAVTGSSLLHDHRSREAGLSWADSSSPQRSPRHNQTPLSDDHCLACQFYAAHPNLTPAVQAARPAEPVGTAVVPVFPRPASEPEADLPARGPPVAA